MCARQPSPHLGRDRLLVRRVAIGVEQADRHGLRVELGQRRELDRRELSLRPEAPTHASLVAAAGGARDATVYAAADDVTGQSREEVEA